MDLAFFLKPFAESIDTAVQESSLISVFLLDVSIYHHILHLLLLYVLIQTIINCPSQLVRVVNVLDNPIHCCLKSFNIVVILADYHAVSAVNFM